MKSGQAKTWQVWRQEKGIQLDTDENGKFYKNIYCDKCQIKTVHRKLRSTDILKTTKTRQGIPAKLAKKIKSLYQNEEAIFLRQLSEKELEVDHKFPQIRWDSDEKEHKYFSDNELKNKFILLTRNNNLLKSRYCEKCFKEGKRGCFPGIYFWYKGNEIWEGKNKFDESGCEGCFWYDPYVWRKKLNELIK